MTDTMRSLLHEQVKILEKVLEDQPEYENIEDFVGDYESEPEETLDFLKGKARDKVIYAFGYIRGVAEERDVTIRQLFDEEGI